MVSEGLNHVVVVGAGLAGARSCEQLRRQGFTGRITLVGAEQVPPYDRPPLTKDVLAGARKDTTLPTDLAGLDVVLRLGERARELRVAEQVVVTDGAGGTRPGEISYDGLVIATGAEPIRLPGAGPQITVRTMNDAVALRGRLQAGAHVLLVGASWIGAEVATAAVAAGCNVTCVEASDAPLSSAVGSEVGRWTLPWWKDVDLRLGSAVEQVAEDGIVLAGGEHIAADAVVSGVGARCSAGWLVGSGLRITDGVLVDEWMRAAPGVVAVGDVALWWSRKHSRHVRLEHWDDAADAPSVAIAALLDPGLSGVRPHEPVPYFWSDQFGHKLQYIGAHDPSDRLVRRWISDTQWTAAWVGPEGVLSGALACNRPRDMVGARMLIAAGGTVDPDRIVDPEQPLRRPAVRT